MIRPCAAPSPRALTAVLLVAAALPRIWAAISDQGIVWPDEIYQSLEPAHHFAFGYGVLAWEFEQGARSWLLPGALGLWLKLLDASGFGDAKSLVVGAKLLMAAISVLGVYGVACLARRLAGDAAGAAGALLAATFPALLLFASRCTGEMVSGTLLVFAALALARRERYDAALAGTLAAVAVFLRYPNGLVLIGFCAWLIAAGRREDLRRFALAAVAVAWLGGVLDWVTWGSPFHSLRAYVAYNVQHQAELYGTAPWMFYATTAWNATGAALVVLGAGLVVALRRWPGLTVTALAYVVVHSAIGHKELRFLLPVLPLLLALCAAGFVAVAERVERPVLVLIVTGLAAALAQRASALTFSDIGQYRGEPAGALSPWHATEGVNRLLWLAGRQPDLCGIWVTGIRPAWIGGYSYLHRPVPIVVETAAGQARNANYALVPSSPLRWPLAVEAPALLPADYTPLATARDWVLLKRAGGCRRER